MQKAIGDSNCAAVAQAPKFLIAITNHEAESKLSSTSNCLLYCCLNFAPI